jgi:hypothetical protein
LPPDENTLNTPPVAEPPAIADGEDPEIARLEEELRRNEGRMNALEIMEIKDRIAALRRARDLINWEKAHPSRLVVKGGRARWLEYPRGGNCGGAAACYRSADGCRWQTRF